MSETHAFPTPLERWQQSLQAAKDRHAQTIKDQRPPHVIYSAAEAVKELEACIREAQAS